MKKRIIKAAAVFAIAFMGGCCIVAIDSICEETTGYGGKLVLDVEITGLFN